MNRRSFLQNTALASALLPYIPEPLWADLHLACNLYTWQSFYRREGRDFNENLDAGLEAVAASGVNGVEPLLNSMGQIAELAVAIDKHGLEMRSIYVNSKLHILEEVRATLDNVLAIAERCKLLGTHIVVTNPSPIRWGGSEDKTDEQLRIQAAALDKLGESLRKRDMVLAYHTHDSEFRNNAKEFHYMMHHTSPDNVTFCLDVHWVYRGSGNSIPALFDVIDTYGDRVTELHIRQSQNNIWSETFGGGDIDYARVLSMLAEKKVKPFLVLEQAVEQGSPRTMSALDAHRLSQQEVRRVFG